MKILIPLTTGFGPQGGWRVLSLLANQWILQGHSVSFLVHKSSNLPYFPTHATLLWFDNKGNIHKINDLNYNIPFGRYFGISYALILALKKLNYDIVLATLSLTTWPIFLARIKSKKYYYVQAYEPTYYPLNKFINLFYKLLSKSSYYLNFEIIVNSEYYYRYKGIKSNKCVYPGIDFSIFFPKQNKIVLSDKKIILGTIGRMEKYKGTYYIIEAFKQLKKENNLNIELHIAFGDKELEKIDGIKIINLKGDCELANYYRSLDIYICAGTYQLGAVHYPVIESMASGVSLITTGYYPSNHENSWLVPIKNSDSIVKQILNIIGKPKLTKMKIHNAIDDVQQFDWKSVSYKMINIFTDN